MVQKKLSRNKKAAKKPKFSANKLREIDKAGLPQPDLGLSRQEFAKLQKQWYAKLADEGFEDLEWVNHATGTGHDASYLRHSMGGGKTYHPGRDLYYQLASNYLVHCRSLKNRPYHRYIWKLHSEGYTYDEITALVEQKYPKDAVSKYTLYYQIKRLAQLCHRWNSTHPEGLLVKRAEDQAEIAKKGLEEFYVAEYNWIIDRNHHYESKKNGKRIQKSKRKF